MAEGWARRLHGDWLQPHSAGIKSGHVDPRAFRVMSAVEERLASFRDVRDRIVRRVIEWLDERKSNEATKQP
jgi:hypothetical protein